MKVDILHKEKVIGHGDLLPADPSMGVAAGRFDATSDYDPRLHAYVIDGDFNETDDEVQLTARSIEFGLIRCVGVAIEDFGETLGERNVTVLGMAYPNYETVFASHPSLGAAMRLVAG